MLNPTDLVRAPESLLFPQQRNQLRRTSHRDAMQNKRGDVMAGSISKDHYGELDARARVGLKVIRLALEFKLALFLPSPTLTQKP